MDPKIPFSRVLCDGNELSYVKKVLETGWLTTGALAMEFEKRFSEFVGAPHACAVNSCTAALHLALEALGVGPGQRVFVPTWTFTATAEVVRYLGADPVFLDVEYGTYLVTPEILERAIASHPDVHVLMLVHFAGQAADVPRLLEICERNGITIVEDAAHAFPSRLKETYVGSLGPITCFSFYANKTITTGEGGILTTNDPKIFERCKVMRLHGIDRDVWKRFTSEKASWEYDVVAPGYKYNLPDLNAAVGLAQLERAETLRKERQRCAEFYFQELSDCKYLDLPLVKVPFEDHSWHLFPVILNEQARVDRNRIIEVFSQHGIGTSVHYKPIHRMSYYRDRYQLVPEGFPVSERMWKGCFSLPIYASLREEELKRITALLKNVLMGT